MIKVHSRNIFNLSKKIIKLIKNANNNQFLKIIHQNNQQKIRNKIKYQICNQIQFNFSQINADQKITAKIQVASSINQLKSIYNQNKNILNCIHLTALLQKVTKRPFQNDNQFTQKIILQIKNSWSVYYSQPNFQNSRAIANTICYMSRKIKRHQLDQEFSRIDYEKLVSFLNAKQFVMAMTGLLKLNLIQRIQKYSKQTNFNLQKIIIQSTNQNVHPGLLVSLWFNLLKFDKSSLTLNDHFANLIKNKHFKNNLVDYTQMLYCYKNTLNTRTVNCQYCILTYPNQYKQQYNLGAHQLSQLYEQLSKLKAITNIYFSQKFTQLLKQIYLKIINEKDLPLRNIANVFKNMITFDEPSQVIIRQTSKKYIQILKSQIVNIQKSKNPRAFSKFNVDSLSFVSLFYQLVDSNKQKQTLKQLTSTSLNYILKILQQPKILSQYNDRTFLRLLTCVQLSKNKISQIFNQTLILHQQMKQKIENQVIKRKFQYHMLGSLMNILNFLQIKSQKLCRNFKNQIENIEKMEKNKKQTNYKQRLNQSCILSRQGTNCLKCLQ